MRVQVWHLRFHPKQFWVKHWSSWKNQLETQGQDWGRNVPSELIFFLLFQFFTV